ncbi:MAG: hypothetical protein ACREN7_09895, partial [Candidatus Dormibacteria bacterium]
VRTSIPDCPIPEELAQRIRLGEGVEVACRVAAEIGERRRLRLHVISLGAERHAREVVEAYDGARSAATV